MVKIEKQKCDMCGEETEDWMSKYDWIHIDGSGGAGYIRIQISAGRDSRINYHTAQFQKSKEAAIFDFCNIKCMIKFLTGDDYVKKIETQ